MKSIVRFSTIDFFQRRAFGDQIPCNPPLLLLSYSLATPYLPPCDRLESIRKDIHQLSVKPDEFLADFFLAEQSQRFKFGQILLGRVNTLDLIRKVSVRRTSKPPMKFTTVGLTK